MRMAAARRSISSSAAAYGTGSLLYRHSIVCGSMAALRHKQPAGASILAPARKHCLGAYRCITCAGRKVAMKLSYNGVWDRTLAMLGAHAPLIGAIAGVFIFLPSLLLGYFFPVPRGDSTDPEANVELLSIYLSTTWYWQLVALVATMVGILAILILVLDHTRPTVGSAIATAVKRLP